MLGKVGRGGLLSKKAAIDSCTFVEPGGRDRTEDADVSVLLLEGRGGIVIPEGS